MVEEKGPALDGQRAGTGATRLVTRFFFIRNALSLMNPPQTNRSWNLMSWNVRGLNSKEKWSEIRDKIIEANCDIICLQETKKEDFNLAFIRNFCPADFDKFEFLPSIGASGGIIIIWKGRLFNGEFIFSNQFAISVEISSRLSDDHWIVTSVYGPCTSEGKKDFTEWLKQIQMPDELDWLIVGDFNLMRNTQDRNKGAGDLAEMFMFNDAISTLGLNEVTLQGRKFTWSTCNRTHFWKSWTGSSLLTLGT